MFLLIRRQSQRICRTVHSFTFQYVSINTCRRACKHFRSRSLHSNMFLLIRLVALLPRPLVCSLHSNMFLLIQDLAISNYFEVTSLHSNMFLLIHLTTRVMPVHSIPFTFQYVSINTYFWKIHLLEISIFTFQYVSINTCLFRVSLMVLLTLHSNMFLLIRQWSLLRWMTCSLYIPICFY